MESVPADEECVSNSEDESNSLTDYIPSISNKVKKSKTQFCEKILTYRIIHCQWCQV